MFCSNHVTRIAASNNAAIGCKLHQSVEGELTRLQSTLRLLVAIVTGAAEDRVLNCAGLWGYRTDNMAE